MREKDKKENRKNEIISKKLEKKQPQEEKEQVTEMKANIILKASLWILTMTAIIMNGDILTEKRTINGKTATNH